MLQCSRCDGCGKIANTEDGEPWSAWESLPPASKIAVNFGIVRPIRCPTCNGLGKVRDDAPAEARKGSEQ